MAGKIQDQIASRGAQNAPATQSVNQMMNSILDGEKLRSRFNDLLGKRAPQFVSSLVSMVNADQNLQKAFFESPMSVIQSALKAAAFDLPIDQSLGYAYIVPFNNSYRDENGEWRKRMEASFILGWKGMNQLALRTGAYKTINVIDIREGELKRYDRLTEEVELDFIEDEDVRESKPVIGYVGYYRLVNGAEKTIYMTVKQIEAHEKKFRKGKSMGWGWQNDWDAMARKTVYRKLIGKWGVMNIEYQSAQEGVSLAQQIQEEYIDIPDDPTEAPVVDEATGEVIGNA
ncbi:MAG: recombinase RecT [Oscillospiraceae bacterium]|nr:recombinase RecT [Oscillospiraceae bacterium]